VTADITAGEPWHAGLSLEIPAEPVELGDTIRHSVLGGADWQEQWGTSLGVGDVLWHEWAPPLEAAGMDHAAFDQVVLGYRRELWFWLLGERSWEAAVTGLAGRLSRRLTTG
jgi:hypothetical protein